MQVEIDTRTLYVPTPKQALAHAAPELYSLYGGAVGGGKSVWLVMEGLQLSLEYPGNRGLLCRNELTSFRRSTMLALERFYPPQLIRHHQKAEMYYELVNGSRIYYSGLNDSFAFERLKSTEWGWAGVDQIEGVEEAAFLMLASRLRYRLPNGKLPRYRMLCTANPDPGWVRSRWIEKALPDHRFIPALPRDNPHLPPGYEANLRQLYPPALAQALLDGDWDAMEGQNYLIPYRDINAAVERELADVGDSVFGVDVAWEGDDRSVCIWRKGPVTKRMWVWRGLDTIPLADEIKAVMDGIQPEVVNVDAIGFGAGVASSLAWRKDYGFRKGTGGEPLKGTDGTPIPYHPIVNGVIVSEAAMDREHYYLLKGEYYFGLARRFRDGDISIPDNPDLKGELAATKRNMNDRGQMGIEKKEELKKSLGRSPDMADALMLAFAPIRRMGGIGI